MDTPEDPQSDTLIKPRAELADFDEQTWEKTVNRDVLVGAKVGEYEVRRRIGAGGMGIVYEAVHPLIGRRAAIKILRPDVGADRGLLQEARAANAVRHRGIVDIYGFGEIALGQYLVMEFLEGEPLDALLAAKKTFSPEETVSVLDQVLAALDAAHQTGLIHRDLKPSNLFMVKERTGDQYVKMLDFGLAKQTSVKGEMTRVTRASAVVGTPEYMAPEQARGFAGMKADLYSVGVIAFELLTGRLPFYGANPMATLLKHLNDPPPRPSEFADVPEPMERLVLQLLEKDPQNRPPSAAATRAAFRRIREEKLDAATEPSVRPIRRSASGETPQPKRQAPAVSSAAVPEPSLGGARERRPRRVWPYLLGATALSALVGAGLLAIDMRPKTAGPTDKPLAPPVETQSESPPISPPVVETPSKEPDRTKIEEVHEVDQPVPAVAPKKEVRKPLKRSTLADAAPASITVATVGGVRADVFVDGVRVGSTPLFNFRIAPGKHTLTLKTGDKVAFTGPLMLRANEERAIRKTWDPSTETLR